MPKAKINAYKKQYINDNDKIKIGICYEGTLASKETDRDIPLSYLYPLMKLPDVEVYSFQSASLGEFFYNNASCLLGHNLISLNRCI